MDSAALQLALNPSTAGARRGWRTDGFVCLRELAATSRSRTTRTHARTTRSR